MNVQTILAVLITAILSVGGSILLLKYILKWVSVDNIPEEEIEKAAKKIIGRKFEDAESEISELKEREERRLKEIRKKNADHEEILIEREKSLNKRSRILDEKSDELVSKENSLDRRASCRERV